MEKVVDLGVPEVVLQVESRVGSSVVGFVAGEYSACM